MVHILDAPGSSLMVQYPMFKSMAVAQVNPSNSCNTVMILGNRDGFLTSPLFNSLKPERKRNVLFSFGCINKGAAHYDVGCHSNTPRPQSFLIYFITVSLCTCGIGKALLWQGLLPSFNSKEIGSVFQSPKFPLNRSSNSVSTSSSFFCLSGFN